MKVYTDHRSNNWVAIVQVKDSETVKPYELNPRGPFQSQP